MCNNVVGQRVLQLRKAQDSEESSSETDEGASGDELEGERSTTTCQGGAMLSEPGIIGQDVAKHFRGHGWHAGMCSPDELQPHTGMIVARAYQ